jgi:hypothetical protein
MPEKTLKAVILQPSYIPWRGYFDQIRKADVFVFYDCVQYDDRGWRNRNKIKTAQGTQWLTIPVNSKGHQTLKTPIMDIPIVWDAPWREQHQRALQLSYGKGPFFREYSKLLNAIYERRDEKLADFTCASTELIARALGINHTRFLRSSSLPAEGAKSDRLLSVLRHLGATHYISGPSASSYMKLEKFANAGIAVEFMDYNYQPYPQLHGPFEPQVTVLDLLFNLGPEASRHF